ncbi:Dabb family protein [Clostridium tagluense]|uniref:Dabb family protein n=1 Tax=Clostridium tagluense TaxID=360422 RepID=UPI001C0C7F48|nr:Dabb family protein [Clostridium tagluense]MBU3126945.1 Dabb family protein [Clostridium tagluense]MBW9155578.1 Dabb family protein [Clostridium tagluense]MCB2299400.1 Dabb family protein [Clostridium tagluense]MCB2313575.1 Dabb family protein [Clostridium tagluense]MCB2318439.1 Dabb family protein [Clostridium tagluense]
MFTHIVFFKLKNKEQAQGARNILLSMEGKIPQLKGLEVGVDVLHTERSYDLVLITRFDSLGDMKSYAVHEYHVNEVLKYLKPMLESSKVVDYES